MYYHPGDVLDCRVTLVNGSGYLGRHVPTFQYVVTRLQSCGASKVKTMEKIDPRDSSGAGREVGEPRILFPRLGVG